MGFSNQYCFSTKNTLPRIVYIITILIVCWFSPLSAQQSNKILQTKKHTFDHITADQGFMQNSVHEITQDAQGFMWFATPNGLYKYDGYNFTIYRHSPKKPYSLSENLIVCLFEDKDDYLWIGTDKELNIFDKKADKFYSYVISDGNNLARANVIYQAVDGNVFIGTNRGLFKATLSEKFPKELSFTIVNNENNKVGSISTLLEGNNGEVYAGGRGGLFKFFSNDPIITSIDIKGVNGKTVSTLFKDENGMIWMGTGKGLYTFTSNKFSNTDVVNQINLGNYNNGIQSITKDHKGNIWLGTSKDGLIEYNTKTNKVRRYNRELRNIERGLGSNSISHLFKDKSGIVWIGTSRGGLSKLDPYKKNFIHYKSGTNKNSLNDNVINAFYEEENQDVWIGTFNGGLCKLSFINGRSKVESFKLNPKNEKPESVFAICKDNYGYLWVGTYNNGLFRLTLDQNNNIIKTTNFNTKNTSGNLTTNKINLLYKDKLGDIWMGSFLDPSGLLRFRPRKNSNNLPPVSNYKIKQEELNSLGSNKLASIFEDSKGVLWVGTKGGLKEIYRDKNNEPINIVHHISNSKDSSSLSNNNVFAIQEDSQGNIWIGTFGGGLNKLIREITNKETKTNFKNYSVEDGLPDNVVYGIIEDLEQNLWLSTNNGLSKFNPETESFKNYNISDGIQNRNFRKFAYHKGISGLIYFGGITGFNVFDPTEINDQLAYSKTVVTDFKIFNKSVQVNDTVLGKTILDKTISYTNDIVLDFKHNAFSFDFASLHFSAPEQSKYAYMLQNFDLDWNYTDSNRRYAAYSNLSPGDYTFKVKSSNKDNVWNNEFSSIDITVLPPIWRTWWMYTIYGLLLAGLMWMFRNYIVIRERFKIEILQQKFEQDKIKELNNLKLEFFTNVSHEFKTPLTLILGPLEKLIKSDQTNGSVKDVLLLMQRNANQLFKLIQQVLEFRKIENNELKLTVSNIDVVKQCKEILQSFNQLSARKNIELEFDSTADTIEDYFDIDKINKILNNLISNAIKFTPNNGKISLKLSTHQNTHEQNLKDEFANGYLQITVKDTGTGIPSNKLPFIFKRFYQANNNLESNAMGSGVGLALTKSLVQLHHGEILVNSKEFKGSTFNVRLPIGLDYNNIEDATLGQLIDNHITTMDVSTQELYEIEDKAYQEAEEKQPVLLVVEDNDDMRSFIKSLFIDQFTIIEGANGSEGVEKALEHIPDLIISDVMMPVMDGKELCKILKSNILTSHIPTILLTAKSSIENRIAGIKLGADAYIPKPFNTEFLLVQVNNLLESRKLLREKYNISTDENNTEEDTLNIYDREFLDKAEGVIDDNLMNTEFGVIDLGSELAYSRMQLYRKLKSITGLSANEFIRNYRLKKAAHLLKTSNLNITEILYEIGFTNRSYFAKCFKSQFGETPRDYKDNKK